MCRQSLPGDAADGNNLNHHQCWRYVYPTQRASSSVHEIARQLCGVAICSDCSDCSDRAGSAIVHVGLCT